MIGPATGEASDERAVVLTEILRTTPGNDSETRRNRMLTAMHCLGSVTSYEGSRVYNCYDPRARIIELRLAGYRVTTIIRAMPTESRVLRYVGVYVFQGPAAYPLFNGLDDAEVTS
jgi:hypothetical protein